MYIHTSIYVYVLHYMHTCVYVIYRMYHLLYCLYMALATKCSYPFVMLILSSLSTGLKPCYKLMLINTYLFSYTDIYMNRTTFRST